MVLRTFARKRKYSRNCADCAFGLFYAAEFHPELERLEKAHDYGDLRSDVCFATVSRLFFFFFF